MIKNIIKIVTIIILLCIVMCGAGFIWGYHAHETQVRQMGVEGLCKHAFL